MADLEVRDFQSADEVRPFVDKGRVEIVKLAGGTVGLGTFEPGWRWSEHVKPLAELARQQINLLEDHGPDCATEHVGLPSLECRSPEDDAAPAIVHVPDDGRGVDAEA